MLVRDSGGVLPGILGSDFQHLVRVSTTCRRTMGGSTGRRRGTGDQSASVFLRDIGGTPCLLQKVAVRLYGVVL